MYVSGSLGETANRPETLGLVCSCRVNVLDDIKSIIKE